MRNQNGKILNAVLPGAKSEHGVRRRGGLESNSEEDNISVRIGLSDFEAVERRIDDADVCALRL